MYKNKSDVCNFNFVKFYLLCLLMEAGLMTPGGQSDHYTAARNLRQEQTSSLTPPDP